MSHSDATGREATSAPPDPAQVIGQLNGYLCGEIAAAESYRRTADRITGGREASYVGLLRQFEEEHGLAAEALRQQVEEAGGEVADSSGGWGVWAAAVHCKVGLFGNSRGECALEHLRDGEGSVLEEYVAGQTKADRNGGELLRNQLIPTQRRHMQMLNALLGQES